MNMTYKEWKHDCQARGATGVCRVLCDLQGARNLMAVGDQSLSAIHRDPLFGVLITVTIINGGNPSFSFDTYHRERMLVDYETRWGWGVQMDDNFSTGQPEDPEVTHLHRMLEANREREQLLEEASQASPSNKGVRL